VGVFFLVVIFTKQSFWSIYGSDVISDGIILSVVLISSILLMCESTPIVPVATIFMACGQVASLNNVDRMQTWLHGTAYDTLKPLYCVFFGYSILLSRHHMRTLKTAVSLAIFCALAVVIFTALPITIIRARTHGFDIHPVNKLIYEARIGSDRWLTRASISGSLEVAVSEYKERNHGKQPPPGFDAWFSFAKEKKSLIIDHFDQIGNDILPFWKMSPKTLRARMEQLNNQPGIAMVKIRGGKASTDTTTNQDNHPPRQLEELVSMISAFSNHLPDMDMPINLYEQPRVLSTHGGTSNVWASTSIPERRHMESLGCPPGSSVRSRQPWNIRDLTTTYTSSYSKGQFITNWERSLDICSQPDVMAYLHGFHMVPPVKHEPYVQLMPVFSRSKTSGFSDILIPLPGNGDSAEESMGNFHHKENTLYWRGGYGDPTVGQQGLRGNHKHRVAHLVNNATSSDETLIILPALNNNNNNGAKFAYSKVPTQELNALLPTDIGFTADPNAHTCTTPRTCAPALLELGATEEPQPGLHPLDHRYILILDTDSGPSSSPSTLAALKSSGVPFISTIFTHWYTERIMPWVHFVPVDIRLTGFHTALSYFTGLRPRRGADRDGNANGEGEGEDPSVTVTLAGRQVALNGAVDDARWIASQGKVWAKKALRREDMEVYLFRLLLEWGRVIDDRRNELGFMYKSN